MTTLDRYILVQTLWRLGGTVLVALLAMLLERLIGMLDLLATQNAPPILVLQLILNLVPHYLSLALSAAFFLSVLLTVRRLNQDGELDAMQAAGMGLSRIARPMLGLALVLTLFSLVLIGYIQPHARYAYRAVSDAVAHTTVFAALQSGALVSDGSGLTLSVGQVAPDGRSVAEVFLHREEPGCGSLTITAERADFFRNARDDSPVIRMRDGLRVGVDRPGARPSIVTFGRFDLPVSSVFQAEPYRPRGGNERELTLSELWRALDRAPPGINLEEVRAEWHARIVRIVSLMALPLLAVPLGVTPRRAKRGAGLVIGGVLLLGFHEMLQVGEGLADAGTVSPWVGLQLPFAVFCTAALAGFALARRRPHLLPRRPFGRPRREPPPLATPA